MNYGSLVEIYFECGVMTFFCITYTCNAFFCFSLSLQKCLDDLGYNLSGFVNVFDHGLEE